jgi:hypothetical protein
LSGGDHRWFKRSTGKKMPVTRDIRDTIIIIIIMAGIKHTIKVNTEPLIVASKYTGL